MAASSNTIGSVDELVAHFEKGYKPAADLRVGMEHEKVAVLADGRAPGHELIARLLLGEAQRRGWSKIEESGNP